MSRDAGQAGGFPAALGVRAGRFARGAAALTRARARLDRALAEYRAARDLLGRPGADPGDPPPLPGGESAAAVAAAVARGRVEAARRGRLDVEVARAAAGVAEAEELLLAAEAAFRREATAWCALARLLASRERAARTDRAVREERAALEESLARDSARRRKPPGGGP